MYIYICSNSCIKNRKLLKSFTRFYYKHYTDKYLQNINKQRIGKHIFWPYVNFVS